MKIINVQYVEHIVEHMLLCYKLICNKVTQRNTTQRNATQRNAMQREQHYLEGNVVLVAECKDCLMQPWALAEEPMQVAAVGVHPRGAVEAITETCSLRLVGTQE